MKSQVKAILGICLGLAAGTARAQTLTYPGCANPTASEFPVTELAAGKGLQEPVGFDLQSVWNAAGDSVTQINIFFVERMGKVKFFNGATGAVSVAATIPVAANSTFKCCSGSDDNGLMGVALDPKFNDNRWIYLWYGPPPPDANTNPRLHLSRFTVKSDNTLDMASEKILIDLLTSKGEHRHAGGPMAFDAHGDLWVTLGQSGNDIDYPNKGSQWQNDSGLNQEWGPSCTASLRGGIMRIHPDDAATAKTEVHSGVYGPGYTIPAGNFGEYWSGQWQSQGKTDLATQYKDKAKVLPEVYVKGNRSPFSIGVHPTKQWLAWGEVNPTGYNDEINLWTHPIFAGHPYFIENNRVDAFSPPTGQQPSTAKDPAAPTNNSPFNNGVTQLPPAMPGSMNGDPNVGNVAMSGPFYVYNHSLRNREKLPPHFDNHFFHMSFQANTMFVNTVDTVAGTITRTDRVDRDLFKAISLRSPLAARVGGDGALYVLNYDGYYSVTLPAVERIRYAGPCLLPVVPVAVRAYPSDFGVRKTPLGLSIEGRHALTLRDLAGRTLLRLESGGPAEYVYGDLRAQNRLPGGLALVEVRTERGRFTEKILL
jgi:cytochrome c